MPGPKSLLEEMWVCLVLGPFRGGWVYLEGPPPGTNPGKVHPPRKVYFPVLTSSDGYLIGGMFLTGMLPSSGFPLGLEKWEGIFQSGKSQGILNRLEKSGKITQNTGKLREFDINII